MVLNLNDKGIGRDLALDGIREPESVNEIKKILKKGNVVVEIGANIGYYALVESKIVGNTGKVYAIEPHPENINSLKKNIKINKYENIEVYSIAIGEVNGVAKMNVSTHSNLHSLFIRNFDHIIKSMKINVITLDNFLKNKRFPNLIRMDLEGYEYNILKGMKKILKAKKPLILFIELHPHLLDYKKTLNVLKTLKKYGFETRKIIRRITFTETKVIPKREYDFSGLKINDLMNNYDLMSGKIGGLEIFFERT